MFDFLKDCKLLVLCCTYNQRNYIEDALKGFVIQQTNFPFICLIMDDASTDGSQEKIMAYIERECDMSHACHYEIDEADITIVSSASNTNCIFVVYFLKKNLYGTQKKKQLIGELRQNVIYEALCEGDDYWTDPNKLQIQYDFLEKNPAYSMCFHRAKVLVEYPTKIDIDCFNIQDRDYSATEIFEQWIVPTASVVYKINALAYPLDKSSKFINGDLVLFEQCAHTGRIRGISKFMSVYRFHSSSISHNYESYLKRAKLYPAHYESMRQNFPLIDKKAMSKKLATRYFIKALLSKNRKEKRCDFWTSYKYDKREFFVMSFRQMNAKINRLLKI